MALETVQLGQTGLEVSEIAFGTARFGTQRSGSEEIPRDRAHDLLSTYADADGNFIDTADVYGNGRAEEYIGEWLDDRDREDFVIASKIHHPVDDEDPNRQGLNRKHLRRQLNRILDRLDTDYVDLLYIHRWDEQTLADEFLQTLDEFVSNSNVLYLGASHSSPNAWKVAKANERAARSGLEPFVVTQMRYNLIDRELDPNFILMCRDYGLGLLPFAPLAGGFLTGKYSRDDIPSGSRIDREDRFADRYLTESNFETLDAVTEVAESHDSTPVQVALAWLSHHDAVTVPIIGARTVDQLEENLGVADISLSEEEFDRLAES